MSVTTTTSRIDYTLTLATQTVAVPFFFLQEEFLTVIRTRAGVKTTLALGADYSTTGENGEAGGSVIFTGASTAIDDEIRIDRNTPINQLVDFSYNGRFPSEVIERALDRLTMIAQEANRDGTDLATILAGIDVDAIAQYAADAQAAAVSAAASAVLASSFAGIAKTATTGGTPNALDGIVTAGGAIPTNFCVRVLSGSLGGGDLSSTNWVLVAGTNAEDPSGGIVRPDDYNGVTNARVWVSIGG